MGFSKRKIYYSPDVMINGKDYLRQALGQVQYIIDREDPVSETTLSKIRKDPNRERILKVFSQLQRSITWWGGQNQMIVYTDSFSPEDKDLRGYNTQRPDIRTAKIDFDEISTSYGSYAGFSRQRLYGVLHKFEMNPARITKIDNGASSVIPNVRIPCRIYSNPEFDRGDKFWQTVFMGGQFGDDVYPRLADTSTVFYDHAFYVEHFSQHTLANRRESPQKIGAQSPTEIREDIGMAVRCYYRDYNTFIDNYQKWEVDQHELCMPNLMFEANYFIDQEKFKTKLDALTDTTRSTTTDDSQQYKDDMVALYSTAQADPDIVSPYDVFYYENLNEEESYLNMVKYFYPSPNKTNISVPDVEVKGAEIFKTLPNGIDMVKENKYKNDQWYGETWINSAKDIALKEKIKKAQRNIIIPNTYFKDTNGVLYQNEVEKTQTIFGAKNQTANLKSIKITLKRHVDYAQEVEGHESLDTETFKARYRSDGRALSEGTVFGDCDRKKYQSKWHLRHAIEKNNYTGKFLEALKDLNDGNFSNFKMQTYPLAANARQFFPIGYENDEGVETIDRSVKHDKIQDVKLFGFNWLDFMVYTLNNSSEAINDDYIFLGPHDGENISTYGDDLIYRYSKSSDALGVLDSTVDSLQSYFRRVMPDFIENEITIDDPDTYTDTQAELYNMFLAPQLNFVECLAYQIDKTGGSPVGENNTKKKLQTWWIWNSSDYLDVTEEDKVIPRNITISDSQVKYGQPYTYTCYGYFAVLSHKYKYSDFRLTKQTNSYKGDAASETLSEQVDRFCVQFYEPLSKVIVPQVFAISAIEENQPQPYMYSNLSEYNTFAPSQFDISKSPQLADFYLNVEPCIKIFKVPLYQKTTAVYDNPGNKITAVPFHVINDENKIGFNISQDNFKPTQYPVCLDAPEVMQRDAYLHSKDLYLTDEIKYYSQSPARYLEIYRMKNKPSSYFDFGGNLVSTIDLRLKDEKYNRTEITFSDKINPNEKYYYMFRYVTENFMPGHVSTIYEAQLVNDGGYTYALFDTVNTSDFKNSPYATKTDSFKKLLQIEPNMSQMELQTEGVDFTLRAKDQLDEVNIGSADNKIWDKTFKVRLTSKKSGKKTDLNVKFRLQTKDFS